MPSGLDNAILEKKCELMKKFRIRHTVDHDCYLKECKADTLTIDAENFLKQVNKLLQVALHILDLIEPFACPIKMKNPQLLIQLVQTQDLL